MTEHILDYQTPGFPEAIQFQSTLTSPNNLESLIQRCYIRLGRIPSERDCCGPRNGWRACIPSCFQAITPIWNRLVNGAIFKSEYHDLVVVRDIKFYSLCEHHLLPFFGQAHVAYIPDGQIIGLSKIPRIVEMFARRLQVQERMTHQIAETLEEVIHPRGVAILVEGTHMCSVMRGVKQTPGAHADQLHVG